MYGGRVRYDSPMLWSVGFMVTFVIGGMTGVLLASPAADFELHNSLFLVAHFHNVIIGSVLFGAFAGYTYWFPKAFGFRLDERLGKAAFWCWLVGFYVAFMPLYVLGLEGMTRRMQHYDRAEWHPWVLVAGAGALIILCGIAFQVAQLVLSIRNRAQLREAADDPWDGRTLEWATRSPPPAFNFAVLPHVASDEPHWDLKRQTRELGPLARGELKYESLHVPRNSATGFITAFLAVVTGFSLIWHIWWLAVLGLLGAYITIVFFAWRDVPETVIPADEVARLDHPTVLEPEPAR
jgi:cytochrome o ubiquinol oxidase subunit 1